MSWPVIKLQSLMDIQHPFCFAQGDFFMSLDDEREKAKQVIDA